MHTSSLLTTTVIALLSWSSSHGAITFTVNFSAQAQADLTAAEQTMFLDAVDFWDDIILGYRDGVTRDFTLEVDTYSTPAEDGLVSLGGARPLTVQNSNIVLDAHTTDNRFILSRSGLAQFNTHPDAGNLQATTLRHEIGHALGIGSLWEENELHNDGDASNDSQFGFDRTQPGGTPGQYAGPNALIGFQAEFDAAATFVPIELDGPGGTANSHWNEVSDHPTVENSPGFDSDPGDGAAAPTDPMGRSLDDEMMTGLSSGDNYLSATTILSLRDLGFTTIDPLAIPEPGSSVLLLGGLLILGRRKR